MSTPMRRVVHEWPANQAGRRAAELAHARGQLVYAERVGDVVRVVLRVPAGRTPTGPRQHRWVRWAAAATVVLLLLGALFWVLYTYWALILGAIVVALFLLALLGRVAGGGGDDHPCNR